MITFGGIALRCGDLPDWVGRMQPSILLSGIIRWDHLLIKDQADRLPDLFMLPVS